MKNDRLFKSNRAIFLIILFTTLSIIGIAFLFNVLTDNYLKVITESQVESTTRAFYNLENITRNMLSATMDVLLKNKELGNSFQEKNREKLYRTALPIFKNLNKKTGLTHWSFLNPEPDKTCFLRIHHPDKYGDRITRYSFEKCIITKKPSFGSDLGKTAFVLRVVHPFYLHKKLIGYLEMGIELDRLFNIMKLRTGIEFGFLVFKKHIDKEKWALLRADKKVRNNWNDLENLLLITNSNVEKELVDFFEKYESVPSKGVLLKNVRKGKEFFLSSIIPFYDSGRRKIGTILMVRDISNISGKLRSQNRKIIILIVMVMGLMTFFMIFFHNRAEKERRHYRFQLEEMIEERARELKVQFNARVEAERKHSEASKLAEQSSRLASIGVMAAGISHEINQPLNAIKVTADSIQYWDKKNPGQLPEYFVAKLNTISKSANRITDIIRHMRTFWAYPEYSSVSVIDLNQAINNTIALVRQELKVHKIKYEFVSTEKIIPVKGNMIHFEQIIINIISNAIHSLNETQNRVKKIQIKTAIENSSALLTIKDNGTGFLTDSMEKLFDPFFSTKLDTRGTGLGLAIVKSYLEKYNGIIRARNNQDGGAIFSIQIPVSKSNKGV